MLFVALCCLRSLVGLYVVSGMWHVACSCHVSVCMSYVVCGVWYVDCAICRLVAGR